MTQHMAPAYVAKAGTAVWEVWGQQEPVVAQGLGALRPASCPLLHPTCPPLPPPPRLRKGAAAQAAGQGQQRGQGQQQGQARVVQWHMGQRVVLAPTAQDTTHAGTPR